MNSTASHWFGDQAGYSTQKEFSSKVTRSVILKIEKSVGSIIGETAFIGSAAMIHNIRNLREHIHPQARSRLCTIRKQEVIARLTRSRGVEVDEITIQPEPKGYVNLAWVWSGEGNINDP